MEKEVKYAHEVVELAKNSDVAPEAMVWVLLGVAAASTMTMSTANREIFVEMCRERWDDMVRANMRPV